MNTESVQPAKAWADERLSFTGDDVIDAPLWHHNAGLSYTATGYGQKIPTTKKVRWHDVWRRVYCCIFSNAGTCYIVSKGQRYIVEIPS